MFGARMDLPANERLKPWCYPEKAELVEATLFIVNNVLTCGTQITRESQAGLYPVIPLRV